MTGERETTLGRVVLRNSALVLGAQVVLKIVALAFSVYVVRRLGDVDMGRYATVTAFVATLGIATDWGLGLYLQRELAEEHGRTAWMLPDVIAIRLALSTAVAAIAPLLGWWLYGDRDVATGAFFAGLGLLVYAFQTPLAGTLAAHERLDCVSALSLIGQVLFWGIGLLFLAHGSGFLGLLVASLIAAVATALLYGTVVWRRLGLRMAWPSVRRWPRLVAGAFPFGLSGIAYVLMERFDTLLMSFVLSEAAVGWYSVPCSLITMVLLVAQSVGVALFPSMTRNHRAAPGLLPDLVYRSIKALLIICLPIVVGGTLLADRIILALYTGVFANSIPVLRIALWALPALFLGELLPRVALTLHLERRSARIDLASAAAIVLLNVALVPRLGVAGGALALVAGRVVRLALFWSLVDGSRMVGRRWGGLLRVALAAAVMGAVVLGLRQVPGLDTRLGLAAMVGAGAVAYAAALLALGGVERGELSFLRDVTRRRVAPGIAAASTRGPE